MVLSHGIALMTQCKSVIDDSPTCMTYRWSVINDINNVGQLLMIVLPG